MLKYIYGKEVDVDAEHAVECLALAHMHGLGELETKLTEALLGEKNEKIALQVLTKCEMFVSSDLEESCMLQVAQNFEVSMKASAFDLLTASQLGHVLNHQEFTVSREEVALEALLKWQQRVPEHAHSMGLLLQSIKFALLSVPALHTVEQVAQSLGPNGLYLQKEAKKGLLAHARLADLEDQPMLKRRRTGHWWPGFGASIVGGVCVAGNGEVGEWWTEAACF